MLKFYSDYRIVFIFHHLSMNSFKILFNHLRFVYFYFKYVTFITVLRFTSIHLLGPIYIWVNIFLNLMASNNVQYIVNYNDYTGSFRPPIRHVYWVNKIKQTPPSNFNPPILTAKSRKTVFDYLKCPKMALFGVWGSTLICSISFCCKNYVIIIICIILNSAPKHKYFLL